MGDEFGEVCDIEVGFGVNGEGRGGEGEEERGREMHYENEVKAEGNLSAHAIEIN